MAKESSCGCGCGCSCRWRFMWGVLFGVLLAVAIRGLLMCGCCGMMKGKACPMMGGPAQMEKAPAQK